MRKVRNHWDTAYKKSKAGNYDLPNMKMYYLAAVCQWGHNDRSTERRGMLTHARSVYRRLISYESVITEHKKIIFITLCESQSEGSAGPATTHKDLRLSPRIYKV